MKKFSTWGGGLLLAGVALFCYSLLRNDPRLIRRAPPLDHPIAADLTPSTEGLSIARASIETSRGIIRFRFYPTQAPNTSRRIAALIENGFYDGLTFHRVVPGFVIQGGDPKGDGTGGSGVKLKPEFNLRRHGEGVVGLARGLDPGSGDSQFYITLSPQPHLDDQYTIFGKVVEGMEVAKSIQKADSILKITIENVPQESKP